MNVFLYNNLMAVRYQNRVHKNLSYPFAKSSLSDIDVKPKAITFPPLITWIESGNFQPGSNDSGDEEEGVLIIWTPQHSQRSKNSTLFHLCNTCDSQKSL